MARLSLHVSHWRMIRMALPLKQFRFAQIRTWVRKDKRCFDWLLSNGFFVDVGDGLFELTDKGHAAADLGYYEWDPPAKVVEPEERSVRAKGKK